MKMKAQHSRTYSKDGTKRKVYIYGHLHKKREIANKNLMMILKLLEKQDRDKPEISRCKIIRIRAEINEIETKKLHKNSTKQKVGSLRR
jgi:hypothetical protein